MTSGVLAVGDRAELVDELRALVRRLDGYQLVRRPEGYRVVAHEDCAGTRQWSLTRIWHYVATTALVVMATIVVVVGAGLALGRWRLDPVRSGSMTPDLPVGSAVIATPERFSQLAPGQIIIFHAPDDGRLLVHRIVEVSGPPTAPMVRTKGDANANPDPWQATLSGEPVWRVRHVIPVVGQLIQLGRASIARIVMLALAAAGLMLALLPSFGLKGPERSVDTEQAS